MTTDLPRTVTCNSCGAPVALSALGREQTCGSCGHRLVLPAEVQAILLATERLIASKLAQASALDAASGRVGRAEGSALLFAVALVLLLCSGLQALSALGTLRGGGGYDQALPAVGGIGVAILWAAAALVLHGLIRRRLCRAFTAFPPEPGAPHGACHACGGPLPPFRGSKVRCSYCRCENLTSKGGAVRQLVGLQARVIQHADDMLRAAKWMRRATTIVGYGTLISLPLASAATYLLLSKLLAA